MDRASRRAPRGTRRVMATAGPSSGACRAGPLGLGGAARTGRAGSCSRAAPTAGGVRGSGALGESPVTTAAGCVGCVGPVPRRTAGGAVAGGPRGTPVPSACTPRLVPPVTGGGRVGGWSEKGGTARAAAPRLVARAGRRSERPRRRSRTVWRVREDAAVVPDAAPARHRAADPRAGTRSAASSGQRPVGPGPGQSCRPTRPGPQPA